MASEPKKSIEQMLETLAKARRAQFGDDPKMPNPMRARLHQEIGRTEAADDQESESRPSWLTMFWPRLTVAAALATLIVLVPAIWWNQSHPVTESVALRDRTAGPANELNPAVPAQDALANAPAVSANEPTVNLAENTQIKMEPAAAASSESEASKPSSHLAQGRRAADLPREVTGGVRDKEVAAAKIQSAPAAAVPSESKAKSDAVAEVAPPLPLQSSAGSLGTTRQFSQQSQVQSFRNNAQVSRAANVLSTFQVQQEGNEIRVLDADGSTYTGKIEQSPKNAELDSRLAARGDLAKRAPKYAAKATSPTQSAAPQSYFHATGYNVSLKKTLVFEGNYADVWAQQPPPASSNDREQAKQSRGWARIVGTVRVNGEAPVKVDAIAETSEPTDAKKSEK